MAGNRFVLFGIFVEYGNIFDSDWLFLMRKFILDLPPTTNALYRASSGGGRTFQYLAPEARAWKELAQWQMLDKRHRILSGPLEVTATFYLRFDRDIDNAKLLFDALEGVVIKNDRQIESLHLFKEKDRENPRVEIEVYELE